MGFGFTSSSKSSSTQYTENKPVSSTIGDLSSNNRIIGGDFNSEGLSDENLALVLDATTGTLDRSFTSLNDTISAIQTNSGKAIEATGKAYADAYSIANNDSSRLFDALRPFAVIAAVVAIFYFWGKK